MQAEICVHGGEGYRFLGHRFENLGSSRVVHADVLDAWYPPAPGVLRILLEHGAWSLNHSPPTRGMGIREAIAEFRCLSVENIVLGGGSSDLIFRVLPMLFPDGSRIVMPRPQYVEYFHVLQTLCGHEVLEVEGGADEDFRIDPEALVDMARRHDAAGIVLVNPCNPTGQCLQSDEIHWILNNVPESTRVVIDETYIDYVAGCSAEREVAQRDNLVVFKSMSKVYALSGARVAYAVLPRREQERIEKWTPPYVVSTFGQMAGIEALKDSSYYAQMLEETRVRREFLRERILAVTGCRVFDSVGNFALVDLFGKGISGHQVQQTLLGQEICVRTLDSFRLRDARRFIRISVLDYGDMERVIDALAEVLQWH